MPEHHYTSIQIFIICVLVFAVGMKNTAAVPRMVQRGGTQQQFQRRACPGRQQ